MADENKEYMQVKQEVELLGKQIDQKIGDINTKAENGERISKENTSEIQKLVKQHAEQQEQLDQMQSERKRDRMSGMFNDDKPMPSDQIREALEKSTDFADLRKKGKGRAILELPELKATLLTSTVAPGTVMPQQRVPGIIAAPLRSTILDIIATAPTTEQVIHYVREQSYTSNAAYVQEGQLKPEDDIVLTEETAKVETLATLLRVPKQMMDDFPALIGYITARAPRKLEYVKENAVLFGSGTNGQLEGITTVAAGFAPGLGEPVQAPNNWDVLVAAGFQTTMEEYIANGAVLHSADLTLLSLAKDSQNRYLFPELRDAGTINGMRVARTHAAAMRGKFLVGDFQLGSQLFQRQGLTIEFFDQDRDNVARNLITIRIEERHALANYRPDAFVYGTFAAAKTALGTV
jgi:HK97 family phage major capsid protein